MERRWDRAKEKIEEIVWNIVSMIMIAVMAITGAILFAILLAFDYKEGIKCAREVVEGLLLYFEKKLRT